MPETYLQAATKDTKILGKRATVDEKANLNKQLGLVIPYILAHSWQHANNLCCCTIHYTYLKRDC